MRDGERPIAGAGKGDARIDEIHRAERQPLVDLRLIAQGGGGENLDVPAAPRALLDLAAAQTASVW